MADNEVVPLSLLGKRYSHFIGVKNKYNLLDEQLDISYQDLCLFPPKKETIWNNKFNWGYHLINFKVIHCHSRTLICLLHSQTCELHGSKKGTTIFVSQNSLMVALISVVL